MNSYRSVLETLKFVDVSDILTTQLLNKLFSTASESSELWRDLCENSDFDLADFDQTYKQCFFRNLRCCNKVALLSGTRVVVFDIRTGHWMDIPKTTGLKAEWNTSYVIYTDDTIIFTGGNHPNTSKAFKLHYRTGQITPLQDMCMVRAGHGMASYKKLVYVFGGADAAKSTSEVYNGQNWTFLPPMLGKHSWFAPTRYETRIFLCGGNSDMCEVFETCTNTFTELKLRLPTITEACSFIQDQTLIVLQRAKVVFWDVLREQEARVESHEEWGSSWTNMSPVVLGGKVYLPRVDNFLIRVMVLKDMSRLECSLAPEQNEEKVGNGI